MSLAMSLQTAPSAEGVVRARDRLKGKAMVTPLLQNDVLDEACRGRVLVKAEVLQHCGSFKFRGAYNRVSQLTPTEREQGVLAWSSGNHAQGVALAAQLVSVPAVLVMPADAPALKLEKVRALGAEVITYDRYKDDREVIGRRIAEERGLALAPSYDHADIIEGQGTLALEICEQAAANGVALNLFVVPCGGGGLAAGCGLALEGVSPDTELWIAEPEDFDETWASIRDHVRRRADIAKPTICDAIATPTPGVLTLPILERLVRGGVTITEAEVGRAMVFAFKHLKLVVEPGGVVALAAALAGKLPLKGGTAAITLSGGNVDPTLFSSILQRFG
jgi:threonine dehydratase